MFHTIYAISDRYPVCATRKVIHHKKDVKIITYRNVKNLDVKLFMSDMFNAPWAWQSAINQLSSPSVALVAWSNIFQGIIDKHLPVITKKVKHSNPASWMNEEIRDAMHTRDFLKRVNCHDQYRVWRNKVVKLVKQAKKKFMYSRRQTSLSILAFPTCWSLKGKVKGIYSKELLDTENLYKCLSLSLVTNTLSSPRKS